MPFASPRVSQSRRSSNEGPQDASAADERARAGGHGRMREVRQRRLRHDERHVSHDDDQHDDQDGHGPPAEHSVRDACRYVAAGYDEARHGEGDENENDDEDDQDADEKAVLISTEQHYLQTRASSGHTWRPPQYPRRIFVRTRTIAAEVAFIAMAAASQLHAQKALDLTADGLDRFLKGADAENVEMGKTGDQLKEIDAKIDAFRKCKSAFDAAGTGNGKSGLALRLLMRAKCGASDDGDMQKDREKIVKGPQEAGAKAAGLKLEAYLDLKGRITSYFSGDRNGFTAKALELLDSRQADLSKTMGLTMVRPIGRAACRERVEI